MTGSPMGPGAGPEAIPGFNTQAAAGGSVQTLGGLLSTMAKAPNATPEVRNLAAFVASGRT